jgi:hypothetical protein
MTRRFLARAGRIGVVIWLADAEPFVMALRTALGLWGLYILVANLPPLHVGAADLSKVGCVLAAPFVALIAHGDVAGFIVLLVIAYFALLLGAIAPGSRAGAVLLAPFLMFAAVLVPRRGLRPVGRRRPGHRRGRLLRARHPHLPLTTKETIATMRRFLLGMALLAVSSPVEAQGGHCGTTPTAAASTPRWNLRTGATSARGCSPRAWWWPTATRGGSRRGAGGRRSTPPADIGAPQGRSLRPGAASLIRWLAPRSPILASVRPLALNLPRSSRRRRSAPPVRPA